jgi:hypothetical protein
MFNGDIIGPPIPPPGLANALSNELMMANMATNPGYTYSPPMPIPTYN